MNLTPYKKLFFGLMFASAPLAMQAQTITGTMTVCVGANTTLSDTTNTGVWSSADGGIATVGTSGVVHGVSAGVVDISYSFTDISGPVVHVASVTVNPLPVAGTITGTFSVAKGGTTTLADAAPGGVWSGCNSSVASIDGSGVVTGVAYGSALVSYTVVNGCGVAHALANIVVGDCNTATNITTIAGTHVKGYSGDGGPALAAQMGTPYAVAADGNNNIYIADYVNNVVRKVNSAGIISTIAGTGVAGYDGDGAATAHMLNGPAGVTVDGFGNVYIADRTNERIRKVDASGNMTTIAGNGFHGGWQGHSQGNGGLATAASLDYPMTIALDCRGNIYFTEYGSQMVRRINAAGYISIFAGTGAGGYNGDGISAVTAKLDHPHGLACDGYGNVYIADCWNNRIRKVNTSGIISTYAGNGAPSYSGDGGPATDASIWIPWGITFDACGDLYICDYNNNAVRRVAADGTMSTFAGNHLRGYTGDGGAATAARIYLPSSLAIDGSGNIYIADYGNYTVRLMGTVPYLSRTFAGGTTQSMDVCSGVSTSLTDIMGVADVESGKSETWTITSAPTHGTLNGFNATAVSKGGVTVPSEVSYVAEEGFTGEDEFTIQMTDGTTAASTTITLKVVASANPGTLASTVTGDRSVSLSVVNGDLGGVWSSANTEIATVDQSGNVTAVANGEATIYYTVTNDCGPRSASAKIKASANTAAASELLVYPNPTRATFSCDFTSEKDATYQLVAIDLTGKVVYTQDIAATAGNNSVAITLPASIARPSMLMITVGNNNTKYKSVKVTLSAE